MKKERGMNLEIEPLTFLRIVSPPGKEMSPNYLTMMNSLLIAEAMLAKKNDSAMQHFIAVVKHLENLYGFSFKECTQEELDEMAEKAEEAKRHYFADRINNPPF